LVGFLWFINVPNKKTMLLFAYASNMNVDEFAKTVPSAKKITNAKLPGYKFGFCLAADDGSTKASLRPSTDLDAVAWGVLIEFNDDERGNFFFQEDWFEFAFVNCIDESGEMYKAEAFVTQAHALNDSLLPYDWYQAKIVKIARDQGLPETYISILSQMPHKVDPDEARRIRKMKKL
jgi:hypothetical protein